MHPQLAHMHCHGRKTSKAQPVCSPPVDLNSILCKEAPGRSALQVQMSLYRRHANSTGQAGCAHLAHALQVSQSIVDCVQRLVLLIGMPPHGLRIFSCSATSRSLRRLRILYPDCSTAGAMLVSVLLHGLQNP